MKQIRGSLHVANELKNIVKLPEKMRGRKFGRVRIADAVLFAFIAASFALYPSLTPMSRSVMEKAELPAQSEMKQSQCEKDMAEEKGRAPRLT